MKEAGADAKKIGIMVASHNEDTVRFAIEKMKEIGISPEDKVIFVIFLKGWKFLRMHFR